ncbi:MAG: hypothetical protein LBM09_00320, partial [Candidatus Nomurabacteria bacterium]|nr:hypothetical protein [Candidatus Nomurabacteria bacterium]
MSIFTVSTAALMILPTSLAHTSDPNYMVTVGPMVDATTILAGLFLVLTAIIAIKNRKILKNKMVAIFALLIFIVLIVAIRSVKPELICLEFLAVLASLIMYNTLENPDMQLVRQQEQITIQTKKINRDLRHMDRTKDEFLSLASHQLRTPLTSMRGYSAMLLDGDFGNLTPDQTKVMKEVTNSAEHMAYLVD